MKRHDSQPIPGQGTVEFALVALILFAMILGIMEGGRMLFTYHQLTNASREGARYAVAHGIAGESQISSANYQDMTEYVIARTAGLITENIEVEAEWPGDSNVESATGEGHCPQGGNNAGCPVRVTVNYAYEPMIAMFAGSGAINMSSSSEMRIHY